MDKKWIKRNWTELNWTELKYYVRSAYAQVSQFKSIFADGRWETQGKRT